MSWIDTFGRIYVINLPERSDRRRECDTEFARAGVTWTPGKLEVFNAVRPADAGGFVNLGYHGCFRSHLEVWKKARELNLPAVFVWEDDIALTPHFAKRIDEAVTGLVSNPWHLAYFGHHQHPYADRDTKWFPAVGPVMCTHCYAVHESAYDRLIAFFEAVLTRPGGHPDGGPMSPDAALNFYRERNPDLITLLASPSFATQRSSRSDLSPKWFDRIPVVRDGIAMLRKWKK